MQQAHGPSLDQVLDQLLVGLRHCEPDTLPPSEQRRAKTLPALPASAKPFVLTLHVLYPHVLLDALDLIDRGLVFRLCVSDAAPTQATNPSYSSTDAAAALRGAIMDEMEVADTWRARQDDDAEHSQPHQTPQDDTSGASTTAMKTTHHVRSAQVANYRPQSTATEETSSPSATFYQIHLRAWHCSCPAFAHAMFSPGSASPGQPDPARILPADSTPKPATISSESNLPFNFGGIPAAKRRARSADQGSNIEVLPPACKHILACILAESAPRLFHRPTIEQQMPDAAMSDPREKSTRGMVQKWVSIHEAAGWAVGAGNA